MAEEKINVNEILADQEGKVKRTLSEIDFVHGRFWSQRNDFVKALIPLISAILVATIAFSDSILGDGDLVNLFVTPQLSRFFHFQ